ncbi:MAG TPA: tetratricopeptide repeat protein [Thermoanaerobaculia bacterium]|nr:tetratricopeptide repeat protein [Thermoanaerobaculia bacterium]
MSYPGNPSLPAVVKDRVVSTFQQTLALYKQGRIDEVAAGCNLLLQMDPTFDPARKLMEKTRNPSAPIDVDALLPSTPRDTRSPLEQAREAMASRDFARVSQLTSQILTDDLLNDEARVLGDEAREKLEAAPFVEQFARKAEQQLTGGNVASAKMELEKARALDPTHPEVVRIAQAIASRASGPVTAAPPPAFVVDSPAPSSRSTAQAADFGFTFEEEKVPEVSFSDFSFNTPSSSDFSFDATPAAPPASTPAAAADPLNAFDFATASVATTDDDQKKIEQYLADGDRAYDAGEYLQAIDLWSRIFLIDVTNDLASERIERAKGKRREQEQQAETILVEGIDAFDRGDTSTAHTKLNEVLRLDPRNTTAQDYLDRLSETVPSSGPRAVPAPPSADENYDLFDAQLGDMAYESSLTPPDPSAAAAAPAAKAAKPKVAPRPVSSRKFPVGAVAAILGLLLLGAGGWFAWTKFFTNAPAVQQNTGAGAALITRASILANKGEYDRAIALLRDIKPGDPVHDKAMVMIADLQQKKSGAAQLIDGMPAAQYFEQRIAAAEAAFAGGDYTAARAAYEQAMRVKPLAPEQKAQFDQAVAQASRFDAAIALTKEGKYTEAVANLEELRKQEPNNASIQRLIANARFNAAVTALQQERTDEAMRELDEVLKINPNDELARRSRELAQRYNNEPKDLLYKIYVKYLPLRAG